MESLSKKFKFKLTASTNYLLARRQFSVQTLLLTRCLLSLFILLAKREFVFIESFLQGFNALTARFFAKTQTQSKEERERKKKR